jgi:hypothetical protein
MASGGSRKGSGRPKKFTFNQKLALANEVTIIQRERNVSRVEALEILHSQAVLRPEWKSYQRYLTPKFFDEEVMSTLLECDREGILRVLPTLEEGEL